jgi:GTP cyclohydrolase I
VPIIGKAHVAYFSNGQVIGKDTNEIHFVSKSATENWKQMRKEEVAEKLSHKIVQHLKS